MELLIDKGNTVGRPGLEEEIRSLVLALSNLRFIRLPSEDVKEAVGYIHFEFRIVLKVGGERRRCEIVVQGSGRMRKLRKCSMAAWRQ